MGTRPRINRAAVCSTRNYEVTKKLHRETLQDSHQERVKEIREMNIQIVKKVYYLRCPFTGKLIKVTAQDVQEHSTLHFITF